MDVSGGSLIDWVIIVASGGLAELALTMPGGVAERSNARDLKSRARKGYAGSNPVPTAFQVVS